MQAALDDLIRLSVAAALGGLIGLEREAKHRPAGLRTNLLICVGAAAFTLLSNQLAARYGGDHTRIAAQIIPGIGFIGAGSILHARGDLVTGLTSAATLFLVASVGMAVGGGMYWIAVFTTILILGVLRILGYAERRMNLKKTIRAYEVTGSHEADITANVNGVLETLHFMMMNTQIAPTPKHVRVQFECQGTYREHAAVLHSLQQSGKFESVAGLGPVQSE